MILPETVWVCPIWTGLAREWGLAEGDDERIIQRQSRDESGVTIRDSISGAHKSAMCLYEARRE